ncbi:site-specific integrase [Leifsonia shinshuensis]|uniref:tyrosine-type recombinase/integrase n=1 Tax=Leifsonia shinshuensis TaxID=150026 RepID=UPI001F5146A6|nr:tyrosine-type recombinase/integrase [Leifsonia shinshuensis]MCI0156385.1 site-specific integrase [Leifsonia shinshuensis]
MGSISAYETVAGRRYRVRYRTPGHQQTDKRGFRTKRDAELYLASLELAKARGDYVPAARAGVNFQSWSEKWIDSLVQVKPSTLQGYVSITRGRLQPRWGSTPLNAITHSDIQSWISDENSRVGARTVGSYHRVFSMILKYAVRDGRLGRNPADGIRLPRIRPKKHPYLTHAQLHELAALCGSEGLVVLFLGYTGLRWGELAALECRNVDFTRRRVQVDRAVVELTDGQLVYGSPKNHQQRSVPFPSFPCDQLRALVASKKSRDLLFTSPYGRLLRVNNWKRKAFDKAADNHPDLLRPTVHDLRHTAASLAISAGANVKAVQRMLGHASAAMTLDVYADLFDDDLDAVGDALSRLGSPEVVSKVWANPENAASEPTADGLGSLRRTGWAPWGSNPRPAD